jgi:hypothetical protein
MKSIPNFAKTDNLLQSLRETYTKNIGISYAVLFVKEGKNAKRKGRQTDT